MLNQVLGKLKVWFRDLGHQSTRDRQTIYNCHRRQVLFLVRGISTQSLYWRRHLVMENPQYIPSYPVTFLHPCLLHNKTFCAVSIFHVSLDGLMIELEFIQKGEWILNIDSGVGRKELVLFRNSIIHFQSGLNSSWVHNSFKLVFHNSLRVMFRYKAWKLLV